MARQTQLILYATESSSTGITVDAYIEQDGIQRDREDTDGSNAGRVKSGTMIRDRLFSKRAYTVKLRPMYQTQLKPILDIIEQEYYWASVYDARLGWRQKMKAYTNNNPVTTSTSLPSGAVLMSGATFKVIEV